MSIKVLGTTEQDEQDYTILKITKRSFMQRFTQAERIAVRNSVDDIVIDIHEDLKMASNVDLSLAKVKASLEYLVYIEILEPERVAEMLVEGTATEAF